VSIEPNESSEPIASEHHEKSAGSVSSTSDSSRPAQEDAAAPDAVPPEEGAPDADSQSLPEDELADSLPESDESAAETGPVEPLEFIQEDEEAALERQWYIIKVQVNREDSIREALQRRVKVAGLDKFFGDIIVPTEDVAEFTKSGKRKIVKRKLYPGYIVVDMAINDDTWFLVRETPGIGDFTGSAGKPSPMPTHEIEKILKTSRPDEEGTAAVRTGIPFKIGDRVRVKEGNFQNFEGDVASIDQANGRVTVTFLFFGRSTPIEIPHWQIEAI
jgi:transcriptional antiterminator NusG